MPLPKEISAFEVHTVLAQWASEFDSAPLTDAFRSVAPEINQGFADNFSAQVDSFGSSWPPRKDKLPHPLLILSSAMKRGVSESGAAGHIEEVQPRSMAVGIDASIIKYAAAQNFGNPSRNLPAREYVFASDATLEKLDKKLTDSIYTILVGA